MKKQIGIQGEPLGFPQGAGDLQMRQIEAHQMVHLADEICLNKWE